MGRPGRPRTVVRTAASQLSFVVDVAMHDQLCHEALRRGISVSELVRACIRAQFGSQIEIWQPCRVALTMQTVVNQVPAVREGERVR